MLKEKLLEFKTCEKQGGATGCNSYSTLTITVRCVHLLICTKVWIKNQVPFQVAHQASDPMAGDHRQVVKSNFVPHEYVLSVNQLTSLTLVPYGFPSGFP